MKEKTNGWASPEKTKTPIKQIVKQYLLITLGCVFYAVGISLFVEPAHLASGGMTGIALIINAATGFSTGYLLIILNVPMFILGLIFFGWRFLVSTSYATVLSGLLMKLCEYLFGDKVWGLLPFSNDVLVNAVIGAVLFAIGMGLIFRMGASTAGTDVIVKILRKKLRHIKTGYISFTSDMIIVFCSIFVSRDLNNLFYTALLVAVFTAVFDFVLYGGNTAKLIFIVSEGEKAERICDRALHEIKTGATFIDAQGAYSGNNKRVLMCVTKPYLYPRLRDVVREEDRQAFMIVSSAKEIYGEGYKDQNEAEV